jgi:hypothetical protein
MDIPAEGDIIDVLLDQHEQLREVMAEVEATTGAERAAAFERFATMIETHEESEQRVVHPVTSDLLDGAEIAELRIDEEEEANAVLAQLRSLDPGGKEFAARFTALRESVLEHAQSEEAEEFPRLRELLPQDQLLTMADQLRTIQSSMA